MNTKFASLGTVLNREQAKKVMGGDEGTIGELGDGAGGGGCCAHSADWGYQSCGLSMEEAQNRANQYASTSGHRGFWCCAHC